MPTAHLVAVAVYAAISLAAVIAIPDRRLMLAMLIIGGVITTVVSHPALPTVGAVIAVQALTIIARETAIRLRRRRRS